MKNKKGVSFGRIILYIIFIFLLVAFIWSLVLTFKAIKKESGVTEQQINNSLRMVDNNDVTYSVTDYLTSANSYYSLNTNNTSCNFFNYYQSYNYNNGSPISSWGELGYWSYENNEWSFLGLEDFDYYLDSNSSNILNVGMTLSDSMYLFRNNTYGTGRNYINGYNVLNIVYNTLPVPISYFNFSLSGNSLRYASNVVMYFEFVGDSSHTCHYLQFNTSTTFNSSIISNNFPTFSLIKRFGFIYYLSAETPLNQAFTIPSNAWSYSICNEANIYDRTYDLYITFESFSSSQSEADAYYRGYQDGVNDADEGLRSQVDYLNGQVNSLNTDIDNLNSYIDEQSSVINSLRIEIDSISSGQYSFKNLFWTIADTPFKTMHNVLNFDFFGVNLFRFFVGVITSLGLIWLIKKIL